MRYVTLAAALMVTALSSSTFAQSPADHEAHHPQQQNAAPAPTEPAPPAGQPGTGQGMMGGGMMRGGMMGGNMPMMNMMQMMRGQQGAGMSGMAMIDHVEGRIAFLRAELKITDAQDAAWNAFADALRANAKSLGEVRASMMAQTDATPKTLVDRLGLQEKWLAARLEGTRAIKAALTNLVATFSEEQKKAAVELLTPHMGMGMMAMRSGMHQGQMGPGQPGEMMQGR